MPGASRKARGWKRFLNITGPLKKEAYVDLVLIGKKLMDIPDIQGLKYLGYVSEADKLAAFKGAVLSLQPSPLESLSITTLESFSVETPVLVNRRCPALLEHVESSGGGLAYDNQEEFLAGFPPDCTAGPALRRNNGAQRAWNTCDNTIPGMRCWRRSRKGSTKYWLSD